MLRAFRSATLAAKMLTVLPSTTAAQTKLRPTSSEAACRAVSSGPAARMMRQTMKSSRSAAASHAATVRSGPPT